ncbi:MAG: NifU family protein [bacterium]|nr:NifU family protein [bacterium]
MPKRSTKGGATVAKVKKVVEELRPAIQGDGGDVSLVGVRDGVVKISFEGACTTCPISTVTLKMYVEETLKKRVPGITRVEAVG